MGATLVGFALHTAGLSQRWTEAGHFPAVGLHDGASFLAWAIVLVFLLTYVRDAGRRAGLLVAYPVAFGLVLVANLAPASEREDPILQSLFLPIHTHARRSSATPRSSWPSPWACSTWSRSAS